MLCLSWMLSSISVQAEDTHPVDKIFEKNKAFLSNCLKTKDLPECEVELLMSKHTPEELFQKTTDYLMENDVFHENLEESFLEDISDSEIWEKSQTTPESESFDPQKPEQSDSLNISTHAITLKIRAVRRNAGERLCRRELTNVATRFDPWKGVTESRRAVRIHRDSLAFSKHYLADSDVMLCLVSREVGTTFRPATLNYTFCDPRYRSTAIGLTQITKRTLKNLFDKGFRSRIDGFSKIENYKHLYNRLILNPQLQIEVAMAIMYYLKMTPKEKRVLTTNPHTDELNTDVYKTYYKILSRYRGNTCSQKNKHYAHNILDCAQCLKKDEGFNSCLRRVNNRRNQNETERKICSS